MLPCVNHPDRPADATLDWDDDTVDCCAECVVPVLEALHETLVDMFLGEPVIRIRIANL
jgi:hypothetical protein